MEDIHKEGAYFQVFVKSHDKEYFGQAHVDIQNGIEEFLAMGNMTEDIPSESTSKDNNLFMDWVNKNITEIENQRCTRLLAPVKGCLTHMLGKRHILKTPYGW